MDIKQLALQRAAGMLKGAGVTFVVLGESNTYTSDNTQYIVRRGDNLYQSAELPQQKRSSPSKPRRDWKWTGYVEALSKLQAGDSWSYEAESVEDAKALQKAVSSFAHRWGAGNSMTSVTGSKLEVLRLV